MTTNDDDFWGNHADWPEVPEGARREPRAGAGKTVSRWWNNVVGGGSTAHREHGDTRGHMAAPVDLDDEPLSINPSGEHPVVRPVRPSDSDPSMPVRRPTRDRRAVGGAGPAVGHEATGADGDEWDDDWEIEPETPSAPRPGVDPLLARLGGAVIVLTLLVPLALGIGSGHDQPAADAAAVAAPTITLVPSAAIEAVAAATTPTTAAPSTVSPVIVDATTTPASAGSAATSSAAATTVTTAASTSVPPSAADAAPAPQVLAAGAVASGTAERVEQSCAIDYTAVAGDFWIRLADAAGIELAELLDANDATVDTPLYPGSTICLPEGATVPAPPATTAPATTQAPAPATTTKPAATTPATTVKPAVSYPTPSAAEAQQIIRDVWPDELEDRAIEIAGRESNFVATARNSCCYGLFQINWTPHKGWLAGLGITSPEQLFDATSNAYAAYALYMRSGGWGPWS